MVKYGKIKYIEKRGRLKLKVIERRETNLKEILKKI